MIRTWFTNIKIQSKLFLAYGLLVCIVAMLAYFATLSINNVNKSYISLISGPQQRLLYVSDAVRELMNIRRNILSMGYFAKDNETVDVYYRDYQKSAGLFMSYVDGYYQTVLNDLFLTEDEKMSRIGTILDVRDIFVNQYKHYVENAHQASLANDLETINSLIDGGIPLGDELALKLDALRELALQRVDEITLETQREAHRMIYLVIVFSIGIFALAVSVSLGMSRIIKTPIVNMEEAMKEIAGGNLSYPVRNGCRDELGMLSEHIGDMVDQIAVLNRTVTIIDNLDEMIFVTDLSHNLMYVSRKAAEIYEIDRESSLGKPCYSVMYALEAPCEFCPLPRLLPQKESLPFCEWEHYLAQKDLWLSCRSAIVRWVDGNLVHFYSYKDTTLQKIHEEKLQEAAETAREASRMKSAFLANMSHEIRTPMNGIIGFSELALDDEISPKTRDYLQKIKTSSEGLLQIINDILDISKIEAGKIVLEHIPFNIHDVFRNCQMIAMPKAMEKGITLFCYAEPAIGKKVVGDPTRLHQVLLNLLINAIKFTNVGIVKLLSAVNETTGDRVSIRFEVKDSGIGMSPEQINKIFEPFTQADDSTTRKYGGTGLGLTITKNIVELMGGELHVESTLGVGSKFSFNLTLPVVDAGMHAIPGKVEPLLLEKPIFEGRILVCEDNKMNQQVICDHLSRVGFTVTLAVNGSEGVKYVKERIKQHKQPFNLIFMDIHMPVMDGLEAANKLAELDNTAPIVALTANIMPNDRDTYYQHGMSDCLAKPFTAQELWNCLRKHITPVGIRTVNQMEQDAANEKLHNQLLVNFLQENIDTFDEIKKALDANDIKRAHRIVHSLKGVAGLIGKTSLQEAALALETALSNQRPHYTEEQLDRLNSELTAVLRELSWQLSEWENEKESDNVGAVYNMSGTIAMFEVLEPMLRAGDTDCLDMLADLRVVPGTEKLIDRMEHFNFTEARNELVLLKQELGM